MKNFYKKIDEKILKIKDNLSGYDKEIIKKTFRLPNGIIENFFIDKNNDSCQIFCLTKDNDVVLVKQFRPGNENENVELPGGGIEKNENKLVAAERELLEETGYEGNVKYLTSLPYSPYSTGQRHLFVAYDCEKVTKIDLDHNEFLSVIKMPLEEFLKEIKKGKIRGIDCAYIALDTLGLMVHANQ